ncbi:MAG: glycosyltransferase family 1 protein [Bauldia sp.]
MPPPSAGDAHAPRPVGVDDSGARVLEIGGDSWFKRAYPKQTSLLWTGWRNRPGDLDCEDATPLAMARAFAGIRERRYDLVVVHPSHYAPFSQRNGFRAFFQSPWRPWSALTRVYGTAYFRLPGFSPPPGLGPPLVVIDAADIPAVGKPTIALMDKAKFVFKRELPIDRWRVLAGVAHPFLPGLQMRLSAKWGRRMDKLRPVNLPLRHWDEANALHSFPKKEIDLFFAGSIEANSTLRRDGIAEIARLADAGVSVDYSERALPPKEFLARMARAWLTWSPEGIGWQCYRHFESLMTYTVPVINAPTVIRATPLVEGVHAIYYTPENGGLTQAIRKALADKPRLKAMAEEGHRFAEANATMKACCDYVLRTALA